MRREIRNWPFFEKDEIDAAVQVLQSGNVNYWTGQECKKFEEEFADYLGVQYAVTVANGTVALEAALLALDVGKGDEVIVPPRSFIATASSVVLRRGPSSVSINTSARATAPLAGSGT